MTDVPILPGATLGVLGGGQLGRMFVHAAQRMGYATAVLDPDEASPAGRVSHHHIRTPYLDRNGLMQLADLCAAVTTEFENVPAAALEQLAARLPVAPAGGAVAVAQDRAAEKEHFARCGVACGPWSRIETAADLAGASPDLFPGILKTARLGYDGKGQAQVGGAADLAAAWEAFGSAPCVLEKRLPLALEFSMLLARGRDGQIVHFPPQRNVHRAGILAKTEIFEGNVRNALVQRSLTASKSIANTLQYVGVLCVEFFVLEDASPEVAVLGPLLANEMAPRPHNSGHYTIDACDVSQFELQVRALAGLPLVAPRQHSPAVMLNLLGDLWFDAAGAEREPPWAELLALPGAHLHLYGKTSASRGRKMGHLTLTGRAPEQARQAALQAARLLGIEPF